MAHISLSSLPSPEVDHIATYVDHEATVAVRASSDFVRHDQIAAFVFEHDLGSGQIIAS